VSLPRLRLETSLRTPEGRWILDADEVHHLVRVRRCVVGDRVEGLLPGWRVILSLEKNQEQWEGVECERIPSPETSHHLLLLAGILKEDAWNALLRNAVEVGVAQILPLRCERSVPKGAILSAPRRMERWQRILLEATKQCGASSPPHLFPPLDVEEINPTVLPPERYAAILDGGAHPLGSVRCGANVAFAVGPEGDFSPREKERFREMGFVPVSLGPRILRAPTAVTVGCSWFSLTREGLYRTDDALSL